MVQRKEEEGAGAGPAVGGQLWGPVAAALKGHRAAAKNRGQGSPGSPRRGAKAVLPPQKVAGGSQHAVR